MPILHSHAIIQDKKRKCWINAVCQLSTFRLTIRKVKDEESHFISAQNMVQVSMWIKRMSYVVPIISTRFPLQYTISNIDCDRRMYQTANTKFTSWTRYLRSRAIFNSRVISTASGALNTWNLDIDRIVPNENLIFSCPGQGHDHFVASRSHSYLCLPS